MATHFEKASDELEELFDIVRDETTLAKFLVFKLLCNVNQKELAKIVRNNELVVLLSEGVDFAIVVNEKAFDMLTPEFQKLALHECLAGISVSDTDVVSLNKPDFTTFTGVLKKFGDNQVIAFKESVKSVFDKIRDEEAQLKAEKGIKRGRKPKA
jgi:hypothetical protein